MVMHAGSRPIPLDNRVGFRFVIRDHGRIGKRFLIRSKRKINLVWLRGDPYETIFSSHRRRRELSKARAQFVVHSLRGFLRSAKALENPKEKLSATRRRMFDRTEKSI